MFTDPVDADAVTPGELLARYEDELRQAVEAVGTDDAAEATGVDADRLEAPDGDRMTLEEAATLLAAGNDRDPDGLLAELRDHLMLSMSTAIVDVDAVASDLDAELSAREIQAKIEGRLPMTVAEYAQVNHYIASRQ